MSDSPFVLSEFCRPHLPPLPVAVAVAVSGGPDSMALCHALASCYEGPVHALSVDHGLRAEAAAEAAQVGDWVGVWPRVQHHILTREGSPGHSRIQEQARQDRYALLADYCARTGITHLFTAHHRDDQVETLLFRLAKGSGLDGLAAMRPVTAYDDQLTIIRPLLEADKESLLSYCAAHDIAFVQDPSNDDDRFARARLRRSAGILAAEGLTAKRLAVTAARLGRARDALDHYAATAFAAHLQQKEPGRIVFNLAELRDEPAETRLRVLLRAVDRLGGGAGGYGPRREKMENLATVLFTAADFKTRSLGGCLFSRDDRKGLIVIETEAGSA